MCLLTPEERLPGGKTTMTTYFHNRSRIITWALGMAILTAGLQACTMASTAQRPSPAATVTNGVSADYIIGAGDVLEILVWRNEAISRVVTVRPDGKISLPLINDVLAAGLTPAQLREQIALELKKFKEIPEVSVIVTDTKSQVVYVIGQVIQPGPYPLGPNASVLQIVAQAGGFTPFADRNSMVVIRRGKENHKEQRIQVSYKSIIAGRKAKGDITLQAGDTIVVP
jgi:polysaccharide export outer membrane protein